jgi:pilus assembly protein CpaD
MKPSFIRSLLLAMLAMVPLAACSDDRGDWRDHQRIVVERRPAILNVEVRDDSVIRPEDMTRLQSFVDVFLNRGEAPVTLAVAKGEGEEADELAKQRAAKMAELLNAMGVPQNHLVVRTIPAGVGSVEGMARLAYDVYAVRVPQCGDWSDNSSFSFFRNDPSPSFGCAVTRNIGLMVDNPRDLVRPHELDGRDATRGATIIGKYRAGEETISKGTVSTTVSGVAGSK